MEISPCELQLGLSSEMHPTCLADPMSLMEHTSCRLTRTTIHLIKYAKGFFDIQVTLVLTFTVAVQSGC